MAHITRNMLSACAASLFALAVTTMGAAAQTISYPAPVAAKVNALSADKQAFLTNAAMLERAGLTVDDVSLALQSRNAEQIDSYVSALMQVIADARFNPATDMAEIPLNPEASAFNFSTTLRPPVLDKHHRAPGPFSIANYMYQPSGIPTFARAPIALRTEDLTAGKVEVAFMGIPLDFSSGWRDAKHGPMALRTSDGLVGNDIYTGLNPSKILRMADFGDISVDNMSVERTVVHVREMVGSVAATGAIPFIVGGDHSLMYPDVAAMVDTYGKGKVGVIQLDAHYEGQTGDAHYISDTQAVTRLLQDGIITGRDIVQVGVRGAGMSAADKARTTAQGIRMHSMADIEKEGWQTIVDRALAQVRSGPEYLFVSFDMSVLDPAYAPGVGRPAPNGLTMREAVPLVRTLCAQNKVVGFELLDPAPILDISYKTAQNANYILHSCLAGIAQRKSGAVSASAPSPAAPH